MTTCNRFLRSALGLVLAVALVPDAAGARLIAGVRVLPHTGAVMRSSGTPTRSARWHSVAPGSHVFYGTIVALSGSLVSLRLRSGRLVSIDGTTAISVGNFSAPLFVGKMVAIDGSVSAGKFTAAHIFRLSNLGNLAADR